MDLTSVGCTVLIVHEDEVVRGDLQAALEPMFAVTVAADSQDSPEEPFDIRVVSHAADRDARQQSEEEVEQRAVEQEQQRRLLGTANRALKQQQRDLAAANQRLEEANEKLRRFASTDGLTGLYNHRYFQVTWRREITRARRYGEELSVMLLDLDHFKGLNDLHGHPEGDLVLREFAQLLLRSVRAVDLVARYGGEEFVVSLPRTGKASAMLLADRLRVRVESYAFTHGITQPGGRLTTSVGVATFPDDGDTAGEILARADSAMYRAKRSGRNQILGANRQDSGVITSENETVDTDTGADFEALVTGPMEYPAYPAERED